MKLLFASFRFTRDIGLFVRILSAPGSSGAAAEPESIFRIPPTLPPPAIKEEHHSVEEETIRLNPTGLIVS
jgi:hypothetical protein